MSDKTRNIIFCTFGHDITGGSCWSFCPYCGTKIDLENRNLIKQRAIVRIRETIRGRRLTTSIMVGLGMFMILTAGFYDHTMWGATVVVWVIIVAAMWNLRKDIKRKKRAIEALSSH